MDALRIIKEVRDDGYIHVNVPDSINSCEVPARIYACDDYIKLQEKSNFVKDVILSEDEDIWNDLM